MKKCIKCDNVVPSRIKIDGKLRNLNNRKYCLECSPFGQHNTRQIHIEQKCETPINLCTVCGKNYLGGHGKYKNYCPSCRVTEKRKNKKLELINLKGGKCQICGYEKCPQALQFHHVNQNEKEFSISSNANLDINKLIEEVNKCILVCGNCHSEIHANLIGHDLINSIFKARSSSG